MTGNIQSPANSHRRDHPLLAVGLYFLALVSVVMISILVKHTSERVPVQQLLVARFALCLIPIYLIGRITGSALVLRTHRIRDHLIRSFSGICSIAMYFVAVSLIPLAAATAISYSVPLFCAVLSIPLIGETIGYRRWAAALIGFIGVLIISWPGEEALEPGAIAAIASAIAGAIVVIYLRKLSDTEAPMTSSLIYNSIGALVLIAISLFIGWVPVQGIDWLWMILIGLLAGIQQFCFASAFRFAEATFLAPFEYMALIMAAFGAYMIWGEVPQLTTWVGGVIISVSGLFMLHRQTKLKTRVN